ncbi:MAG: ParA family protein [Lachnospiraceae bacterium]|nr:ParA family protein [Lachnospiraceae bacterium]
MAVTYCCAIQKGGVGKTTTCFNLAYSLAKMGYKVLAVDFDSQSNLSTCFGKQDSGNGDYYVEDLMLAMMEEEELPDRSEFINHCNGVDYIASTIGLSVIDAKLRMEMGSENMLRDILRGFKDDYDVVLIDTCPSLGTLTINALAASDRVIIPADPELLTMMGLKDFLKTVSKVKKRINPNLEVAGILLTKCDNRTNLCKVITDEVEDAYKDKLMVFHSRIPKTVKVGEAIYYGMSVEEYDPKSPAGVAYSEFAKELVGYES